ncbi:MAG: tRNA lysidine(34) synthetase TilS [Phycisphaeraceae bacterium]|nr:tRNA lysidine(34) synthetase TilS [Phycisphaeraceae bacterium]
MANTRTIIPPRHPFVKAIVDGLAHHCDVASGQILLLAISGGADSVALLRAMTAIAQRRRWKLQLVVGHVQHHLRDEAEDEAHFVQALATSLNLPYIRRDLDIPKTGNTEALARTQRYDALRSMAKTHHCTAIVTAHHGQDQLETLLMRLLRGSGLRGLAAMSWQRPLTDDIRLLRPMLAASRELVLEFLNHIKQSWCEDPSNTDITRLRARLRQTVIPELLNIRPDLPQQIVTTTNQIQAVNDLLDTQCQHAMTACQSSKTASQGVLQYNRKALKALDPTLQNMVLRQILLDAGLGADRIGANQLQQFGKMIRDQDGSTRQMKFGPQIQITLNRTNLMITVNLQKPGT